MSTDSEIIARSIDDPGAFSEIFERHARSIGAFATRRVGYAGDDVLSETFLVAFRRRRSFDTDWDSCLPWLFGIASRLIRRHRAEEARHWRSIESTAGVAAQPSTIEIEDVGERLDAAAEIRVLSSRIAALSAQDRETLLLYAWGDLSYEEIATALRIPVGTVRSRLNRVRRRLDPTRGLASAESV